MAAAPGAVDRARKFEKLCNILDRYGYRPSGLIPILQAIQHEYQYLPEEVLTYVATSLDVPPARVFGVATFYAHFALEPKGKHVIRICDGTACHVKHSLPVLSALHEKLGTDEKRKTSADMLFTVETVACLGACGLAPVVVIDDQVFGGMTPERALALVEEIRENEIASGSSSPSVEQPANGEAHVQ
ncbi:complex I 24 kDa subunit family protein [Occallatibacter savannae]|uniref:NADH-quinone oxidoreductase subunit NuoE family protein n=1 Tax=Occallatibacter savannae TaxID=1002691 RepID=UPI000D689AEF|nr:NAD(P)H-dependent oxidoreductase subunit E [Occallatibacter savannae]